jgi:hypothetical protein
LLAEEKVDGYEQRGELADAEVKTKARKKRPFQEEDMWNTLDPEQEQHLRFLIQKHGLQSVAEPIVQLAQKSLRMRTQPERIHALGRSRLGGLPDVPSTFSWPRGHDGEHMVFVAQINLAEVAAFAGKTFLPPAGMLYFFLGEDEPSSNIACRVIFLEEASGIHLQPFEAQEPWVFPEGHEECIHHPCRVTFEQRIGLPLASPEVEAFLRTAQVREEEWDILLDAYAYELRREVQGGMHTHLLGYASGWVRDPVADARARAFSHDQEEQTWQLLLEVDSEDDAGFMWWDAGLLHFLIKQEDLRNRHFDEVYASIETT